MNNETEIIEKYIERLPQEMRDFLIKNTWAQKLILIQQTNKLTEEQSNLLKAEVFLTIIGMENYSDFEKNVKKNVVEINPNIAKNICIDVENNIFSEIRPSLIQIEKLNDEEYGVADNKNEEEMNLNRDKVLGDIENPIPTKPIVQAPIKQNPIGNNAILDAQHNLPAQEKKVLISSSAVPSRGPILGNLKPSFSPTTNTPEKTPTPATPTIPVAPMAPAPKPIQPITQPTIQVQKPAQTPIPPAPQKYSVDPYREPTE